MNKDAARASDVPLHERDIVVGRPVPWAVYDKQGHLLLGEGMVVRSEQQRAKLVARGLYRERELAVPLRRPAEPPPGETPPAVPITVPALVQDLMERLAVAFRLVVQGQAEGRDRLLRLAEDVHRHCRQSTDAVLGILQLDEEGSYALLHPLHAGVLTAVMLRRLELSERRGIAVIAGALSHDIGLLDEQDALQRCRGPLSREAWSRVHAHPSAGAGLLRRAGVKDPDWLDVVLHHHERVDGSGYPEGLQGEAVSPPARLLAIADIYSAMIRPRPYRDAILAKEALRDIFLARGETIDPSLAQAFIKDMGVFPPGAVVRVASGEIGVVTRRGRDGSAPGVTLVIGADGRLMARLCTSDGERPEHRITESLPLRRFRSVRRYAERLWEPLAPSTVP